MTEITNIHRLRQPGEIDDPLTDIIRAGARRLLALENVIAHRPADFRGSGA